MPEYKKRSTVLHKKIWITGLGKTSGGRAVDIDENGGLVVINDAGETITLNAGEVRIRGIGHDHKSGH